MELPAPGRVTTKTPTKPTAIAVQRRQRTHSPNIGPDSAAMKNGVEKVSAWASSSRRYRSAAKLHSVEPRSSTERPILQTRPRCDRKPGTGPGIDSMNGNRNAPV